MDCVCKRANRPRALMHPFRTPFWRTHRQTYTSCYYEAYTLCSVPNNQTSPRAPSIQSAYKHLLDYRYYHLNLSICTCLFHADILQILRFSYHWDRIFWCEILELQASNRVRSRIMLLSFFRTHRTCICYQSQINQLRSIFWDSSRWLPRTRVTKLKMACMF